VSGQNPGVLNRIAGLFILLYNSPMSETIKAGDVVQLKSGGPNMAVDFVEGEEAACTWFFKNKKETSRFPLATLKLATELESASTSDRTPNFIKDAE
jgi:uncharacterized protein YodC (DUF2158 family)